MIGMVTGDIGIVMMTTMTIVGGIDAEEHASPGAVIINAMNASLIATGSGVGNLKMTEIETKKPSAQVGGLFYSSQNLFYIFHYHHEHKLDHRDPE